MKKTLKKQAREAEKKILEENEDFYNEIVNQYFPQKETKSKRRLVLQVSSIAAACLILITAISVLLFNVLKEDNVEYLLQNEVIDDSDIDELKSSIEWFYVNTEKYDYRVSRTYDSVSGDVLYYEVHIEGSDYLDKVKIYLYVNPNYKTRQSLSIDKVEEKDINGVKVKYGEEISQDSNGLYNFNYSATLTQHKVEVYIKYEQTWIDENTHFFAFLEEIIN